MESKAERRKRKAREKKARQRKKKTDTPEKRWRYNKLERERKQQARKRRSNNERLYYNHMDQIRMRTKRARMTDQETLQERARSAQCMSRKRKRQTPDQIEQERLSSRKSMRKHRMAKKSNTKDELLTQDTIEKAKKEALKYLHRNCVVHDDDGSSPPAYAAHVCVICDCFIIGTEELKKLTKEQIKVHRRRLSVKSYEEYYQTKLPDCLVKQYEVRGLKGLLLSPRAQKLGSHYVTCSTCHSGMHPSRVDSSPPKFSIANGFVIGEIPKKIQLKNSDGSIEVITLDAEEDISPMMRALLSPKRPYGWIFAFTGGRHTGITGHFQFFETDQSEVSSAVQAINDSSLGPNIFCMCCGRFTPEQRQIVQQRCEIDTRLYLALYTWFVEESGHPAFKNLPLPTDIPAPVIIKDTDFDNNTDTPGNVDIENTFEGAKYYFSTGQDPSEQHSVYGSSEKFSVAMMKCSDPTLLTYGGNYANMRELNVEDILPFVFPFGIGGPKMKRRTRVSMEACFYKYNRVALPPFLRGDAVLVFNHMFGRLFSYRSGVMTSRSMIDGVPLGERLASLTVDDLNVTELADGTVTTTPRFDTLMKAISTSCRTLGHTTAAAKEARKRNFAMMDFGGVNALFLTLTPCDECSFRVRLYCKPGTEVSALLTYLSLRYIFQIIIILSLTLNYHSFHYQTLLGVKKTVYLISN